jgi:DNA-binding NarL/FixJ family response regulator
MEDAFEPLSRIGLPACAVNEHGRITYWNQGAADFFRRSTEIALGTEWHSLIRAVASEGCCPLCHARRSLRSGGTTVPERVTLSVHGYHQQVTMIPMPMPMQVGSAETLGFLILPQEFLESATRDPIPLCSRVRTLGQDRIIEILTPRERDILACVVEGQDARTIASELGISHATARNYVQRILTKLGVRNKAEAVNVALTYNLLAS